MEIYLENKESQYKFETHFATQDSGIRIVSTDAQDAGKFYKISKDALISIDEDCEGMIVWWKEFSPLEGKSFSNSAHFISYELI